VIIRTGCVKQRRELKPLAKIWGRSSLPWLHAIADLPGSSEQQAMLHAVPPPAAASR